MNEVLPPLLSPATVRELLGRSSVRVLDVRTPGEFDAMHIRGSYNVPLDTLGEHAAEVRSHVQEPVVLVCQSGNRARKAEDALRSAGMPQLHVLDGGIAAWTSAGLEVERGAPRVSLERQVRMLAGALGASGAFLALLVSPVFALVPALLGLGLVYAGATDSCMMGLLLSRLPYNRRAGCDVDEMVRALRSGQRAPSVGSARSVKTVPSSSCDACGD
jgi:rhodanese-related sulfurtransferase